MVSDSVTTLEKLKEAVKRFSDERDWGKYHNAKELSIGIVTEASELLQRFRFKSEKDIEESFKTKEERERITDELSDILYFLLRFAERYDIDLSQKLSRKLDKNREKYPIEKFKGSNRRYDEI